MVAEQWIYVALGALIVGLTIAVGRTTKWRPERWIPPHERHIQDRQDGDEALSDIERQALAELEALHLHRKHPYC